MQGLMWTLHTLTKHSSLLRKLVNYGQKRFITLALGLNILFISDANVQKWQFTVFSRAMVENHHDKE